MRLGRGHFRRHLSYDPDVEESRGGTTSDGDRPETFPLRKDVSGDEPVKCHSGWGRLILLSDKVYSSTMVRASETGNDRLVELVE